MQLFRTRHQLADARLGRRVFLAALSCGVAAPVALRFSKMAVAQTGGRPTRLFVYYVPHGLPIEHTEVDDKLDFAGAGVGVFGPLAAYKQHCTVLRGVSNTVTSDHPSIRVSLTGTEGNPSIDYLIANQLGSLSHVLGAQPYRSGGAPDSDAHLFNHGGWVTPIANPADALEDLFPGLAPAGSGTPMPPAGGGEVVAATDFRTETLALTEKQVERLRGEVSELCREKTKLSTHLESLAGLKSAQSGGGGIGVISCESRPSLPSAEGMAGKNAFDDANFADVVDGHLEAAASALFCGTARIIGMQNLFANSNMMMNFPGGPGVADKHHDPISHSDQTNTAGREAYAKCQRWFVERLVEKFIKVLDAPDPADSEHTVLENTTILLATEVNDGKTHQSHYQKQAWDLPGGPRESYLPWLLIGGGGGYLQGGRLVNVPRVDHRDVLATVADSMGVSLSTIGGTSVSAVKEIKA